MVYYFIYFLTKFLSRIYFPRTITGQEHIPLTGPVIFASNHVSNLDPVILGISSIRRLNFMAKHTLFRGGFGWFLTKLGAFPIKRNEADFGALKEAAMRLKKKKAMLIFLEGTRRRGSEPSHAQPGIGFLAVKTRAQVIPVHISGSEKVMPPGSKFVTRHPVTIRYGAPVAFDPAAPYQKTADLILQQINLLA